MTPAWLYFPYPLILDHRVIKELPREPIALHPLARSLGYDGPPLASDEARRANLCGELDGLYAYLYGLTRDELAYITTTFSVLGKSEEREHGEYRTARTALAGYDALVEVMR